MTKSTEKTTRQQDAENESSEQQIDDTEANQGHNDAEAEEEQLKNSLAELLNECTAEELAKRVVTAETEMAAIKDGYIRACAEVENVKRRSRNEIVAARKFALEGFALELLTVLDSLDQASKVEIAESDSEAVVKMHEGLALTMKQFEKALEKFGVNAVESDSGVKFDPKVHQAISILADENIKAGHIISVMQKGYMLKDRLLRPAMVVTAQ